MTAFWPGVKQIIDKGFGGSRGGDPINGAVLHHTANGGGKSALDFVANANSRNSHPTYLVQNNGDAFGIVHPDRRPYSTAGRPDTEAVAFEIDNESGAPNWPISAAAMSTVIDICVYHAKNGPRAGRGFAKNIPGRVQTEFFIAWHRQYVATTCPGDFVIGHLDYIVSECIRRDKGVPQVPPVDPNVKVEVGALVGVAANFGVFGTAANARAGTPVKATYPKGNYYVYKIDKNDVVNLTDVKGKPGGWVKIAAVGLTAPNAVPLWNVVFDDTPDDPNSDYAKVQVEDGKPVKKPAQDPVRAGYRFLGWYDLNGSTTAPYDFSKPVKGLLTLIAVFEPIVVDPDVATLASSIALSKQIAQEATKLTGELEKITL